MIDDAHVSEDAVLGGRLRLRQPKRGHRVGHDAILLAAATPGAAGQHAVDLGAGIGGAGLALGVRVPGLRLTLVEIDPGLAALAEQNAALNGMADRVSVLTADAETVSLAKPADIVLMNPPFNDPRRQQASPDPQRRRAHMATDGLLDRWVSAAARLLRPDGLLVLIWRADDLESVRAALLPRFGAVEIRPVLPRPNAEAIRVLVRARQYGAVEERQLEPLALNGLDGRPSAAAEAILREGRALT